MDSSYFSLKIFVGFIDNENVNAKLTSWLFGSWCHRKSHCAPPQSGGCCVPAPLFKCQSEVFVSDVAPCMGQHGELPTQRTIAAGGSSTMVEMKGGGCLWSPSCYCMYRKEVMAYALSKMKTSGGIFHLGNWYHSKPDERKAHKQLIILFKCKILK